MQVEEYWDDEIVEVVEGKQLKVRPAKCFGFIIINWIRREESPLSDPETETGFPVLGLFCNFPIGNAIFIIEIRMSTLWSGSLTI